MRINLYFPAILLVALGCMVFFAGCQGPNPGQYLNNTSASGGGTNPPVTTPTIGSDTGGGSTGEDEWVYFHLECTVTSTKPFSGGISTWTGQMRGDLPFLMPKD